MGTGTEQRLEEATRKMLERLGAARLVVGESPRDRSVQVVAKFADGSSRPLVRVGADEVGAAGPAWRDGQLDDRAARLVADRLEALLEASGSSQRRCVACGLPIAAGSPTFAGWCLACHAAFPKGVAPHDDVTPFLQRRILPLLEAERAARERLQAELETLLAGQRVEVRIDERRSVRVFAGVVIEVDGQSLGELYAWSAAPTVDGLQEGLAEDIHEAGGEFDGEERAAILEACRRFGELIAGGKGS